MLKNKKILLGVSGSIAAYKSALLIRLLVKEGAEVKVVMSTSAEAFITPLTLATLSKNPVLSEFYTEKDGTWNNHVELGLWADLFLIAPATGNTLAKLANGICDNLLGACYLSARCPVWFAPAMDLDMWLHPATQRNIKQLEKDGMTIIQPGSGELASGLEGQGRMAEPEEILEQVKGYFGASSRLSGKKALVTAGPTYENLDPVRFIGNYSSGKMGFAIAEELAAQGAEVTLVSGPTHLKTHHSGIHRVNVVSAEDMLNACTERHQDQDIVVMSAAVADYRPENIAQQKIKKKDMLFLLKLTKTTDVLKTLGASKPKNQILVGFALETENEVKNAKEKLKSKNLDFIVLYSMNDIGAGFSSDQYKI
ncbi:MAG: bifunctional phosphopantothenoylcysteine decarboxylase/phosphopantothenate--cysteine ligase CoaBC, partial [Bacteroidota bacterium]|nr:bifunctional phosphopantothenoylcysteine decarboxylase/phosphopantothenate--cysteine ligase CoaBC [Bacteroidota bacterium]MDX5429840.1 bifunctional phosphopantothenoylcysteine decarboxylase/phosphopantothenate--cysteine ligase CoaBC [Bacteroidota bacterium]MDX5468619.1 bifunctional phosphopantothenoylcysteine decarboxylase/phosphopantothenate--cysteine ligase CoaBC [Bacteroidota bacterium]